VTMQLSLDTGRAENNHHEEAVAATA
jgi:hypothetical protein